MDTHFLRRTVRTECTGIGILLVVPSITGACCGLSAGAIADKAIRSLEDPTDEGVTRVRKLFQGIALIGPSICLGSLAYSLLSIIFWLLLFWQIILPVEG